MVARVFCVARVFFVVVSVARVFCVVARVFCVARVLLGCYLWLLECC